MPTDITRTNLLTPEALNAIVNRLGSSGWISGGAVTDGGGDDVDVAFGRGLFRAVDDETATLELLSWPASVGLSVPADTTRHIGVDYNNGSPQAVVETSESAFNQTTTFHLAMVVNEGSVIHVDTHRFEALNHAWRTLRMLEEVFHVQRSVKLGGLILGETGAREITVSAGSLYVMNLENVIAAIDTSAAGTFDRYYRDGGVGWTKEAAQTDYTDFWDDGDGGLAALGAQKWTNAWFYLETDGDLVMLYGQAEFATEGFAEEDTPPSTIPDRLTEHGILIGRIIFKQGSATGTVQSTFTAVFTASGVTDHGDLAGLTDDDHSIYSLADGTRAYTGTGAGFHDEDNMVSNDATAAASQQSIKAYVETAAFRTVTKATYIQNPEVGDDVLIGALRNAGTLLEVWGDTDAGTVDIQVEERLDGASDSTGTERLSADLQLDTGTSATSGFTAAGALTAKSSLFVSVEAVAGATEVWIYTAYAIDVP